MTEEMFFIWILAIVVLILLAAIFVSLYLDTKNTSADWFAGADEWDKPHPCTALDDSMRTMFMHLTLEQAEAIIEYKQYKAAKAGSYAEEAINARNRLLEELTDIKTLCETMMWTVGAKAEERAKVQEQVNQKNHERGYFVEKTIL